MAWAIAAAVVLVSLVDPRGSARFRDPHVLTEPSAWLLHALMLAVVVLLVGGVAAALGDRRLARRSQLAALVVLAGIVVVAGAVGQQGHGSVWAFPLADLVWWFDILVLAEEIVALLLAVALGTPGCEIGVWPELIARARGQRAPAAEGLACIVGLHLIDAREARRRLRPEH